MAGRGPAPKDPSERRRLNRPDPLTVVCADGELHGPELPETHDWPVATVVWWGVWRSCAQAATFTDTDWSFLLDTAVLHAEFWLGNQGVAGELRLRVAKFGATPEDRARLKFTVGEPDKPLAPARLRASRSRRERLLKAVATPRDGDS
jgi:hypothetical protein